MLASGGQIETSNLSGIVRPELIVEETPYFSTARATLRLPSTLSGPQPSPKLVHSWELDEETTPFLAPWIVNGLRLPPAAALTLLLRLPALEKDERASGSLFALADDVLYWRSAAALVLETLAGNKLIPTLVEVATPTSADTDKKTFYARWLPVLDDPKDGPRLALLERAMPPICLAESGERLGPGSPRELLSSYLETTCDALVREWGRPVSPGVISYEDDPARLWIAALFSPDPTVKSPTVQLQALLTSQRAWLRNLHAAGDAEFRIAFRLVAPEQQTDLTSPEWQLQYLLQARDDLSLLVPADTVWHTSGDVLSQLNHRFEQPQEKLLAGLGYAARLFPPIADSLKSKRPSHLHLETQQAYSFLRETAPLLEGAGFGMLVPPWWNKPGSRLGVRLRLKSKARGSLEVIGKSHLSLSNLVRYEWELSIGDTRITEEEFRSLAALKSPLVQIRGQWVQLDNEQIEAAIQFWEKHASSGEFGLLDALQHTLGAKEEQDGLPVEEVVPEGWLAEWLDRLNQPETLTELPQPAGLNGVLRPYQRYGFSWLEFLSRWRLGACLADDMGLGKTIQAIALILYIKESLGSLPAPALLVCPTSVVTNWQREIQRFAPSLTFLVHQGAERPRGEEFVKAAGSVDMVLTSYALVRQDAEAMQSIEWLAVILDEAQNIKNPTTRQAQVTRKLSSQFRLALTGTPVENRLSELWSIMHFLNPGYLGTHQDFRRNFAIPIERYSDQDAIHSLKNLVGPFILRRLKTDPHVIQDLPDKLEMKVYCSLTEEQATLYQAVVENAMREVENSEGIQRRGLVLSMLMQLKQICNHPMHYLKQVYLHKESKELVAASTTTPVPLTVLDDLKPENQSILLPDNLLTDGPTIAHDLAAPVLTASEMAGRSGKLERLVEMLEEIISEGDRALIFTQFAEMGKLLVNYLPQAAGSTVQFLHGGTPPRLRDQMVRRFQEEEHGPSIFILSLKAGGTGLNLTRASHVFHFDRWWNPAVEDQATDRAYRIGQLHNVQVHKFITVGTLEEMIDEMIESKKGLAEAIVGSGEQWLTELSTDQLREMVTLRA